MPSINDIANDFKAILNDIKASTAATQTNTASIVNQVGQLNATTQAGFANLSQGVAVLIQLQLQNNELLAGNNQQNETIICWLTQIAHIVCDIKHNTDAEVELQTQISATLTHLDKLFALVNAHEAMELIQQHELQLRLEQCCPQKEPDPQPCFKDCESPKLPDYRPITPTWEPIRFSRP